MKRILLFLSLSTFALAGALFGAPQANAVSDYDDVVQTTDSLILSNYDTETTVDITNNYMLRISEKCSATAYNSLSNVLSDENGQWAISWYEQPDITSAGHKAVVHIDFGIRGEDPNYRVYFSGDNVLISSRERIQLRLESNGDVSCYYFSDPQYGNYISSNNPSRNFKIFLVWNYDIQYPNGYEGEIIPDTPPVPPSTDVPRLRAVAAEDYKLTFWDEVFFTFDDVPFTCESGFVPQLNFEIWNRTNEPEELIFEGSVSASSQLEYQLPRVNEQRDYRIVGWYWCGEGDSPTFSESSFVDFTITENGTLEFPVEQCMISDFPFINANACLNQIYGIINLLTFNQIDIGNQFNASTECRRLELMDNWLGLPESYQICPQIDSSIRNVITPFVTFILGLLTMRFIVRERLD